jgi:predicted O-methyltransferase YrrM
MQQTSTPSDGLASVLEWASRQSAWWHDSGNLNIAVLRRIAREAERVGARRTAETGCGLSTVVLSAIVEKHLCFTVDVGDSLQKVRAAPPLNAGAVEFVIGPAQRTVGAFPFQEPLDLVLIDGPHGFPFPYLEYYHFYPHIRPGGVLVVDDIHIPTLRQMYDVLRDDEMWRHLGDELTTAFFERTDAPTFDPTGDGWERQRFNLRHFPDIRFLEIFCPGWRERVGPPPEIGPADFSSAGSELAALKAENEALRASTSWRITGPLRAAARLLKRG